MFRLAKTLNTDTTTTTTTTTTTNNNNMITTNTITSNNTTNNNTSITTTTTTTDTNSTDNDNANNNSQKRTHNVAALHSPRSRARSSLHFHRSTSPGHDPTRVSLQTPHPPASKSLPQVK